MGDGVAIETVTDGLSWGEGPCWSPRHGGVLFSDIPADRVLLWRDEQGAPVSEHLVPSYRTNGMTLDGCPL